MVDNAGAKNAASRTHADCQAADNEAGLVHNACGRWKTTNLKMNMRCTQILILEAHFSTTSSNCQRQINSTVHNDGVAIQIFPKINQLQMMTTKSYMTTVRVKH